MEVVLLTTSATGVSSASAAFHIIITNASGSCCIPNQHILVKVYDMHILKSSHMFSGTNDTF